MPLTCVLTVCIGGAENASEGERPLPRVAFVVAELEVLETKWAAADGEACFESLDVYQKLTNTTRRTLEVLHAGLASPCTRHHAKPARYIQAKTNGHSPLDEEVD